MDLNAIVSVKSLVVQLWIFDIFLNIMPEVSILVSTKIWLRAVGIPEQVLVLKQISRKQRINYE
jgi:hypothetical protein